MRDLEAQSDIVIIDTPAALAVSDPLPLMGSVSGVVLVARMNSSTRETDPPPPADDRVRPRQLLGVVATGVASGPGYDGYTPKYYTHDGGGSSGGLRGSGASLARRTPAASPQLTRLATGQPAVYGRIIRRARVGVKTLAGQPAAAGERFRIRRQLQNLRGGRGDRGLVLPGQHHPDPVLLDHRLQVADAGVTITGMPAARYSANRVGAEAILENEDLIRHSPMSPANSSSGTAWGVTERTDAG